MSEKIGDYIEIIRGASGITEAQAKTCFYYAVSTYLIEEVIDVNAKGVTTSKLNHIPILAFIGAHWTGKTSAIEQMEKIVWKPKLVGAQSSAALRGELENTGTVLIDEADEINENLLIRRYARETGRIVWNESLGDRMWQRHPANIFGATIVARRKPFKDPATKSRSITILTKYRPGIYEVREIKKGIIKLAEEVELNAITSHRIRDNWLPLQAVATCMEDKSWLNYAEEQIQRDTTAMLGSQSFEPDEAVLLVLDEEMIRLNVGQELVLEGDVLLSKMKDALKKEFDLSLNIPQIHDVLENLGFKLVSHSGYPKVKADNALLRKLLKERQLKI